MRHRLEQFYAAFGDKGVMFILFALSVVVNSLLTVSISLPSIYPDEITVAGIAAYYSGGGWSGLMEQIGGDCGYVQALVYAPLFLLLKNPYALYKAMLVVNGILVSFIPLIAYHLAAKFGVMRVRFKLLIALCCGMYFSYLTSSKFIWNEASASLFGWLLVLCMFNARDRKNRYTRFTMSLLSGFLCAVSYAADRKMLAVAAAMVLTVLLSRLIFKEKIVNLPIFFISLTVSFGAEFLARAMLIQNVWNGAESSLADDAANAAERLGPTGNFFGVFFSHIYAFMTSTFGMGAIAGALFVILILTWITEMIKNKSESLENDAKVYEPIKHKYGLHITIFALFQFLAIGCASVISALFSFNTGMSSDGSTVFGRYTDNIAPFAMFLVLVFVFLYGIDLKKLLFSAVIYGYACLCFGIVGYPLVSGTESRLTAAATGLVPLDLGSVSTELTGMSYVIMSSLAFSVIALLIVFASCSRRHRTGLVSLSILFMIAYTSAYSGLIYLPSVGAESSEKAEPYVEVSRLLYNTSQSPPIVVFESDPSLAATLQFLAPDTKVTMLNKGGRVPESCLLIAENGVEAPFEGGFYDMVGRTGSYTVYAYGESARDFMRYSSSNG
ncbi:MAG: hypothetical protein NC299_11635 [Lachnospiraceae bacterium]|nr:hypothetical protein [Ruminococcus sp.]MCM1275993.1 hypothetical protein [Lachnospiraceae bacterium]